MQRETKYARSGDLSIAYQVVGNGPIDLVFVMGWISHLDYLWDGPAYHFMSRLASFTRLIVFDKRGTGLSDRVAELPSIEQRMDDVRAVMDAAGSERAAVLGISEGAAMCAVFAATYPERTASLVVYGAYAKRLWHPDYPWAPTQEQRAEFLAAIDRGWGGVVDLDTLAPSTIGDAPFRRWWANYLQQSASPGAARALAEMNTRIDIRHVLPAIRVPTLILHRTGDLDIEVGGARYMARHIPNATYVELPGDDHLVFAGEQDAVLDEIERFLTGARSVSEPNRVLATILVTEIIGAVAAATRMGDDQWQAVVDAHDRMVSSELLRYQGREMRHSSSGILGIFDGPARAIRCAVAIVDGARYIGLDVRAGLHCGECEIVDGGVQGVAVQTASRVLARSEGGQVVVSSTITDLVAGSGIAFVRLDRQLSLGIDHRLDLYAVVTAERWAHGPAAAKDGDRDDLPLSPRERQVAGLIGTGLTNRQIADELSISVATVERHAANIFTKLGLHSRAQVAVWAAGRDLPGPNTP
jgi:pimeloyl-ACP methyl ester carboxylesterase/DNA-binding CsgD family transcriptional regulator